MSRGVRLSRYAAGALRRMYFEFRQQRKDRRHIGRHPSRDILDETLSDVVPFVLDEDEEAPHGAILEIRDFVIDAEEGADPAAGYAQGYFKVGKPGDVFQSRYLVNIGGTVPAHDYGIASWGWEPVPVNYNGTLPSTPWIAGSCPNGWLLWAGLPGFRILKDLGEGKALAIQEHTPIVFGVLSNQLNAGSSANVVILSIHQTGWKKSPYTLVAYDFWMNSNESVPAGTKVRVESFNGKWYVTQAYCKAASPSIPPE
jgi:hypothetical protein